MAAIEEQIQAFREYVRRMIDYKSAIALLGWDARTQLPRKGVEARSQVIGTLSTEYFSMSTSTTMGDYLTALLAHEHDLDPVLQRTVEVLKKDFDRMSKIPVDRYEKFIVLTNTAQTVWEEAKATNDFAMFEPYLASIVDFQREFIGYWGYEGHPYNTLLDAFEPDMTVDILDQLFAGLRQDTVALLSDIEKAQPIDDTVLSRHFDVDRQREFCQHVLRKIGYDLEAGRLDESGHPFATGIAPGDVRITTRFLADFLSTSIFGVIHESGHAMYEQAIGENLRSTPLHDGASMGIHESQSRFWENIVGRSYAFWQYFYGDLQTMFPEQLADITLEQFHRAINVAKPSLIRTEADELTYNLHIMIRYEIEKGLIDGSMTVHDLPQIWRSKMKEYLGIEPPNDAEGVLQDIHWSTGDFGYFPSYSLGNIYSAQLAHAMQKELPDFDAMIARGEFAPIATWLKQHIHQHGRLLTPKQLIEKATHEPSDAKYLVAYLNDKYRTVYGI